MPPVSTGELPTEVLQLLREQIRSLEQLEILLLLWGEPERVWLPADVYQRIRSSERSVAETLELLCERGFAARSDQPQPGYRFAPGTSQLGEAVAALAHFYSERRVRIVEAIYSDGSTEVDEFAKAFRFRKDPHG